MVEGVKKMWAASVGHCRALQQGRVAALPGTRSTFAGTAGRGTCGSRSADNVLTVSSAERSLGLGATESSTA